MKTRCLLTIALLVLLLTPRAMAQESIADVMADRALDLRMPADRAKAVERIRTIENASLARARAKARALGIPMRQELPDGGAIFILGLDEHGEFQMYTTANANAAISTGADLASSSPHNLDGTGVTVGVWDGGAARTTHHEFAPGRVVVRDDSDVNNPDFHTTHVAGTIGALGVTASARGMATNVSIDCYSGANNTSELLAAAATAPGQAGKIYLSNHSYAAVAGWNNDIWYGNGTDQNAYSPEFGRYGSGPSSWDGLTYNSPYHLPFAAAGNDNAHNPAVGAMVTINGVTVAYNPAIHPPGDSVYRNGFETLGGFAVSKNILTVGACADAVTGGLRDPSKASIAPFSSQGPTDDGRIKPDVVANGWFLNSCDSISDEAYKEASGTSMATPNATGSAALLVQQYANLFNGGAMRASTLKGLLIHTATDIGNPGPDYTNGWGLLNVKEGTDLIADHRANPGKARMREDRITASSGSMVQTFRWDGVSPIRATLCWTDPAGTSTTAHDSRTPTLVNNLNLKLIAPNGAEFFPYVMPFVGTWTLASMSQNATTGVNNTDNVEQVYVQNPTQAGIWQAVVSYQGTLTNSEQDFSLLLSGTAQQQPLKPNLARYQKAVGSTWGWSLRPDLFATDGMVSNFHRWRSTNTTGQWLEIEYPRPVTIASAHLYTGVIGSTTAENWANFKLQYYNGSSWVDIPGGNRSSNTSLEVNVIFSSPVTSNKLRLLSTDGSSAVRSLREIAMFGPNVIGGVEQGYPIGTGVALNLAHKMPATASSINGTNYALKAVDGYVDDSSRWLCNSGVTGEWLEIDLLSQEANGDRLPAIGSAHLYSGDFATSSNALSNFTLQYWDGTAWVAIPGATITGNTSTARVIEFSSSVVTNKVRLVNNTTGSAKVAELLLFPPRTGGYPLGQNVRMAAPPPAKAEDFGDSTRHLRVSSANLKLGLVGGNGVFTNDAAGSDALNWQFLLNHRDGSYRIRNVKNGQCLALASLSMAPDTLVIGETYTGMPHQRWIPEFVNASQFRLINAYSGLALQSLGGSTTPGVSLVVVNSASSALQQWDTVWQANHPKKGIAATGNTFPDVPTETWMSYLYGKYQNTSWSYSWGRDDTFTSFMGTHHTFNPMQWGNYNWSHGSSTAPLEGSRNYMQSQGKPLALLGFNEPDGVEQANMTVAEVLAKWPRLQALDAPLVGPCPANSFYKASTNQDWNAEFYAAVNQLGYRVDYTPYHWYANPSSTNLINKIKELYNLYQRPIWLTEFSSVRWSGTSTWTHASNYNFLAEFMWRAENTPELARYSIFNWKHEPTSPIDPAEAPRGNTLDESGNLTPYGELYASWDGISQILPQKAYHLHNHGFYQRMQSPASGNAFAFVTPADSSAGTQWFLTPGLTAGTYRIQTTRDGRPLVRTAGNPAAMGALGQTDVAAEWTLVPVVSGADHDGWYYLQHPLTNQRLKNNGDGSCSMVATSDTTNASKWRFIVPLVPDGGTSAPVIASSGIVDNQSGGTVSRNTTITYTLTFSEDIDASSVTAADFANVGTATISIGAITEISPGVFTVQVTPTSGGSLILSINASAVILNTTGTTVNTSSAILDDTTITVTGANGTWLRTASGTFNWGDGANWTSGIVASDANSTAFFTPDFAATQTVNLESARTIGNITFTDSGTSSHNLSISGSNTLTLAKTTGLPVIDVTQSDRTLTIASKLSGTDGLRKNGLGILSLTATNSNYTGVTSIGAGILSVSSLANGGSSSSIGASSNAAANLVLEPGSTLRYNGAGGSTDRLFTLNGTAAAQGFNLSSIGTGAIAFTNTGNLAFGTVDQTRSLNIYGTNTGDNILAASLTNNGTGLLTVNKSSTGTWVLTGNNTNTNPDGDTNAFVHSGGGLLVFRGAQSIQNAGTIRVSDTLGSTVRIESDTGFTTTTSGLKAFGTFNLVLDRQTPGNGDGLTFTFNNPGALSQEIDGSNIFNISAGSNITSGAPTLDMRAIRIRGATDGSTPTINANGPNVRINGFFDARATGATSASRTLVFGGTSTASEVYGAIHNTEQGIYTVIKNGNGTWTFSANNTYTGTTTVNGGTLRINGNQSAATGAVTVAASAALGGTGVIGGNTTITLNGGLAFNITTPAASHDKLELATGKSLSFSGASVLTITSSGGTPEPGSYVLVSAPGGITGSAPATVNLPAGWFASVSIVDKGAAGKDLVLNVTSTGGPASFSITGIPAQVPVGQPVTGITITAKDASNNTVTSFTGTVTFGGSAGITGTSAQFVAGVLTGVSITPNVAGPGLTLTVTDAGNKTGTATFDVLTMYQSWAVAQGIGAGAAPTADSDSDGMSNLQEFAFGMDPTSPLRRNLQWTDGGPLVQAGLPVLIKLPLQAGGEAFHAVFVRRKDHQAAGLTYTVQFSADLKEWTAESTNLLVEGENAAGTMEVLSIPFPTNVPLYGGLQSAPPKFFRVGVSGN